MNRIFTLLILAFITVAFKGDKTLRIVGTISIPEEHNYSIAELILKLKYDSVIVAQTTLHSNGDFNIHADGAEEYDLFYYGIGLAETYLTTIKVTLNDTLRLDLTIPRNYKMHFGKAVCPKCNKHDQTIEITYGLKAIVIYEKDQLPYTTYDGYGKREIYDGGCVTSDISPIWYCKRDRIKF